MDSPVTNIFSLPVEEGEMQFENFGKYLEFIPADKHNLYRMLFRFASLIQIHFFAKITPKICLQSENLLIFGMTWLILAFGAGEYSQVAYKW